MMEGGKNGVFLDFSRSTIFHFPNYNAGKEDGHFPEPKASDDDVDGNDKVIQENELEENDDMTESTMNSQLDTERESMQIPQFISEAKAKAKQKKIQLFPTKKQVDSLAATHFNTSPGLSEEAIILAMLQDSTIPQPLLSAATKETENHSSRSQREAVSNVSTSGNGIPTPIPTDTAKSVDKNIEVEMHFSPLFHDFQESILKTKLVVKKIPESELKEFHDKLNETIGNQKLRLQKEKERNEEELLAREKLLKHHLATAEIEKRKEVNIERQKIVQERLSTFKLLKENFHRNKECLEDVLRHHESQLQEHYGFETTEKESFARKFHVESKRNPQPVEFRIHILRAIKTKLPKGKYVLMLTQYDSIGGKPLAWSHIGLYGSGSTVSSSSSTLPAITMPVQHQGRYFDRELKVEQSIFAVCPSRVRLRPGFVFILEMFQLAGNQCPVDKIVAWTALPMSNESNSIPIGRFKLPLIRGHHSPTISRFSQIEKAIAVDLNSWLCNIYFETRQLPLSVLKGMSPVSLEFNYITNNIATNGKQASNKGKQKSSEAVVDELDVNLFTRQKRQPEGSDEANTNATEATEASPSTLRYRKKKSFTSTDINGNSSANNSNGILSLFSFKSANNDSKVAAMVAEEKTPTIEVAAAVKPAIDVDPELGEVITTTTQNNDDNQHRRVQFQDKDDKEGILDTNHNNNACQQMEEGVSTSLTSVDKSHGRETTHIGDDVDNVEDDVDTDDEFHPHELRSRLPGSEMKQTKSMHHHHHHQQQPSSHREIPKKINEGTRFDSAYFDPAHVFETLVNTHNNNSNTVKSKIQHGNNSHSNSKSNARTGFNQQFSQWQPLTDAEDMETYSVSLSADPSMRNTLLPGALVRHKLRYLWQETGIFFLDDWKHVSLEEIGNVMIIVFAVWSTQLLHYLGQYLLLKALSTPVYGFRVSALFLEFKYMSSSITTGAEIGVITIGTVACMAMFLILAFTGKVFSKYAKYLPESASKFTLVFGLATILDPLIVMVIDVCFHHYDCSHYNYDNSSSVACAESYTSPSCHCYNGDFSKLWMRMLHLEGSGFSGLLITVMMDIGCIVVSSLFVYLYLIHIHRDGHIVDIWRRIHGHSEEFFLPDDFEISFDELKSICLDAAKWRGVEGSIRKIVLSTFDDNNHDNDQEGGERRRHQQPLESHDITQNLFHGNQQQQEDQFTQSHYQNDYVKLYQIVEKNLKGDLKMHRQFVILNNGAILEIFDQYDDKKAPHHSLGTKKTSDGSLLQRQTSQFAIDQAFHD